MKTVDMHCDTISELYYRQKRGEPASLLHNDMQLDLERMEQGGYILQNFAIFTHTKKEMRPLEYGMKLVDLFYTEIEKYPDRISAVRSYADIQRNMEAGRISALLTIEEGAVCLGELSILRDFYRLGVRMMTLTWNFENDLAHPNRLRVVGGRTRITPDMENGLKPAGIDFVQEMERLGIIIDISHLSDAGIWDVFRYTKKPFVASHSNARAVASHPRNLTDEMLRALAERGGVAGINYFADFLHDWPEGEKRVSRVSYMVEHMKHMRQVGGIGCIGLGSDFDGIECELELRSPASVPLLAEEMSRSGFTTGEIEDVFYRNVLRVYEEILTE